VEITTQISIYHHSSQNNRQNSASNPSFGQLNLKEYPKLAATAITAAAIGLMAVNMNKVQNSNNENLSFQNNLRSAIMIKPLAPDIPVVCYKEHGAYSTVDDALIKCIKEAEQKGLSEDTIFDNMLMFSDKISDSEIETIANSFYKEGLSEHVKLNTWFNLYDRKQLLQDLSTLRNEFPRNNNETIANYIERLVEIRENNIVYAEKNKLKEIMSKIKYEDEFISSYERIELTDEEVEQIKKASKLNEDNRKKLQEKIINDWVSGCGQNRYEDRAFQYAFQDLENYAAVDKRGNYTREPVYRWVDLYSNCDGQCDLYDMVKNEMNPGQIYDAKRIQSCSKNPTWAENDFGDDNPRKNLKLIIHPKSNISRAKDIGLRKYGNKEVVYLKGEKFKVLDKRIVKFRTDDYIYDSETRDFIRKPMTIFRYVVEMQEV